MKTFDIPDGTVTFREKTDLSVGQSRAIALATRRLPKRALFAAEANGDGTPAKGETDGLGFPVDLTDEEIEATWAYNDTLLLAYTAGWTLDQPLPKNAEEIGQLDSPVYGALCQAIAKHVRPAKGEEEPVDEFSVDAVEEQASPTGA